MTEIEILDLLAVLADDFHQIGELSTMNIDALKVQLLDLGNIKDHTLETLHEDEFIDFDVG